MFKALKRLTAFNLVASCSLIMLLAFITLAPFTYASSAAPRSQSVILTPAEITHKLTLADSKKSLAPAVFKELLAELKNQPNISVEQQHNFNFLTAYNDLYAGRHSKAKNKFKRLLQSNVSQLLKFRSNYLLTHLAVMTRDWQEGLKYISDNLKLSARIDDQKSLQNNLLATIIFYNHLGQYQVAVENIEKLALQDLSLHNSCILKQLTVEAKFNLKTLKLASNELEDAVNSCIDADFLIGANLVRLHKAKLYLQENLPQVTLALLLNNSDEVNATQYPSLITEMNNVIARAYLATNDLDNAEKHAKAAMAVNENMSNLIQGVETYNLLYQAAKNKQNLSDALYYLELYSDAEKTYLKAEKTKHLAFQLAQHRTAEQANQIKLLNEKNNYLSAEQILAETREENRHLLLALLTFILIIITLFSLRLWRAHKRVKQLAEYDTLTGAFNRGHFNQASISAIKSCKKAQQDISIIMFDLDLFKKINDNHGHLCGDWALKQTVTTCKVLGRENDIFARLGGEEFCIILPNCGIEIATLRAEECRAAIAAISSTESGRNFSITASFGVTNAKSSGYNLDKLLADADHATYTSKHAGRNQVTVHQDKPTEQNEKLDTTWGYS